LTRVIVIYESKYGNTKRVAETIIEGINEIEGIEAVLKEPEHVEPAEVLDYDVILIGSPNHIGGPTRGIKKFIDKLGKIGLEEKMHACNVLVFYAITWCTRQVASCKNKDKIRKVYIRFNWDYLWGGI
jgi:flavodoxin